MNCSRSLPSAACSPERGVSRREEARRAVAAQVGHQHAAAVGGERRRDLVEGARIVGKAVQQDHRRAVGGPVLLVGDLQHVGADAISISCHASLARRVDRVAGRAHAWRNGGNMARFDRVIRGGMIVDGSRLPRFRGDIGIKDGRDRRDRPDRRRRGRRDDRRRRPDRGAGLRRPAHPLRRPALLGPVLHAVGLARRHLGGHRQLRLRLRPGAAGRARARHAVDDPGRGDPDGLDASRACRGTG